MLPTSAPPDSTFAPRPGTMFLSCWSSFASSRPTTSSPMRSSQPRHPCETSSSAAAGSPKTSLPNVPVNRSVSPFSPQFFHLPRPAGPLPQGSFCPAGTPRPRPWKGPADPFGQNRPRPRLRPVRVVSFGRERGRHWLLPQSRRGPDKRLDRLPPLRRHPDPSGDLEPCRGSSATARESREETRIQKWNQETHQTHKNRAAGSVILCVPCVSW